jgi:hypothetical protein
MIGLGWAMVRAGGWARMLLVAACTAIASGLLLVAATMLNLPERPHEVLFNLVAEAGLRGGTAFATVLLTVPVLLLLYQGIRLGTAARERRFAALRVAGATPNDVRRLGAVEVGVPAVVGGMLGIPVYGMLRVLLGGDPTGNVVAPVITGRAPAGLGLVPTSVSPTWWQILLVVAAVGAVGGVIGWRVSGQVILSPLGLTRRGQAPAPRPWGVLALALSPIPLALSVAETSTAAGSASVGLVLLGVVSLAPWAAYRIGRTTEARATSPATLLAARWLVAQPRLAGRAGAAIGGIGLVAGGAAALGADLISSDHPVDPFFTTSLRIVALALLTALLAAAVTLAVHSAESLLDRRRSVAALAAAGTPIAVLQKAQRHEAALVAVPMAGAGLLLGSATVGVLGVTDLTGLLLVTANAVVVLGLVWVAILVATSSVRPWLRRAASPLNLRTE